MHAFVYTPIGARCHESNPPPPHLSHQTHKRSCITHTHTHTHANIHTHKHTDTHTHTYTHTHTRTHTQTRKAARYGWRGNTLQHTATHCNTLQLTATHTFVYTPTGARFSAGPVRNNGKGYAVPSCVFAAWAARAGATTFVLHHWSPCVGYVCYRVIYIVSLNFCFVCNMCVCMYIYIYTCVCVCIYIYIYTCVYVWCVCVTFGLYHRSPCVCCVCYRVIYMCVCMYIYIYICLCICVSVSVSVSHLSCHWSSCVNYVCYRVIYMYIDTGWRRLIGSPKSQIIFHKRATKYRSLLRKTTYKDKGSYESSPPCSVLHNVLFCL